jgi:hypothetical protein
LRIAVAAIAALLAGCSSGENTTRPDGGEFMLPDSGVIFDGGPGLDSTVPVDAGPYQCPASCEGITVCSCLDTMPPTCGCNAPQSYSGPCDPQVPESCKSPYACVVTRTLEGTRYQCTDGREYSSCSHADDRCTTALGCVCTTNFFGTNCECRGAPDPNSSSCDPMVPASCPQGTCIRVESQQNVYFVCSDGAENQPCLGPGDISCATSLGCTCPSIGGRVQCRCSEPQSTPGSPCDPNVEGACVAPLECQIRYDEEAGGFVSECAPKFGPDCMDIYSCDPNNPLCPRGYSCVEVEPQRFRCVIDDR